ncbi:hypothetical protein [Allomuricauda sp. M10]|uniref:hypothetical protein n=1 Tax=Allomuricauda sp. M10 TaxID=2683292 RepID=UPI001D184028|nr:hypothetical protein [Muricauda sp. M10]
MKKYIILISLLITALTHGQEVHRWGNVAGGGVTNLTYDPLTRTVESDTGTDAVLPLATTSDPGLLPAADKEKLDNLTVSNPYDLDSWAFEISGISLRELLSNKATNLVTPDNTKYPTTLAVSNELVEKVSSATGPPTGWEKIDGVYYNDFDNEPSPATLPSGYKGFRANLPPANAGTGASDIPLDGIYYGDMSVANAATAYTTDAAKRKTGGYARILINAPSLPSVDGNSTYEAGATFAANTDMYLIIWFSGVEVKKFLLAK